MKRELKQLLKYLVIIVISSSAGVSAGVAEWPTFMFLTSAATLIAVLFSIEPQKLRV